MRQVVLDTETTGLEPELNHRVIEIGCVELVNRRPSGRTFHRYLNPERDIDDGALAVHGIARTDLDGQPRFAEIAEELVRAVLADHPHERKISLLAISVSHLARSSGLQLDLPLGLRDEARRPGSKQGMARWAADRAVDKIRERFGWEAIGYGSVALGLTRSVPDAFRVLAEQEL